jgi:outer membrane receptor protein involved in Fe transport
LQSKTQADLLANSLIEHPAFLIFDLQAAYPVKENLSVGLNVNNLFDENYTEKDGYNMPGRSFTVKAVLNF